MAYERTYYVIADLFYFLCSMNKLYFYIYLFIFPFIHGNSRFSTFFLPTERFPTGCLWSHFDMVFSNPLVYFLKTITIHFIIICNLMLEISS